MNNKILRALGELDEQQIFEAERDNAEAYFEKRKKRVRGNLFGAAVCVVLCLFFCLPLLINGLGGEIGYGGNNSSPEGDPTLSEKGVGGTYSNEYGSITFESLSDAEVTLLFEKKTEDAFSVVFYGRERAQEGELWVDFYACTDPNYVEPDKTGKEGVLSLTVNGVKAASLPTAAGKYRIEIDFSKLVGENIEIDPQFSVSGMGDFSMDRIEKNSTIEGISVCLESIYADPEKNCDVLLLRLQVNERISAPDQYVRQLYVFDALGALQEVSAFGETFSDVSVDQKKYFGLDLPFVGAVYKTTIYLQLTYAQGTFTGADAARSGKLEILLNGTDESCRGEFRFLYKTKDEQKKIMLFSSVDLLAQNREIVVPVSFPCEVALVKQILFEPETGGFSYAYTVPKGESVWLGVKVSSLNRLQYESRVQAYSETYTVNGIVYYVSDLATDSGYPAYEIAYESNKNYYSVEVELPTEFAMEEFLSGFQKLEKEAGSI